MKKTLKVIAIIAALCAVFAVSAFAAYYDHCADAMNELGLFKGTQNGYELDREPTRAEAATMLVRLLGAEEEALALTYTAPYTDVADWAKPYVQYLHDNGLTKGTSETTFGYSDKCTAQQYATFLLRALGYSDSDGGDFTYVEAMSFAEEKGVVDGINCNEESFLRDHVAAMSYTALATAPKSGEADLLTKLVSDGAVADAKGYDEMFASYREYCANVAEYENAEKLSLDMSIDADLSSDGEFLANVNYSFAMVAELDGESMDKSKMSYIGTESRTEASGTSTANASYYYTDGYIYMDIEGQKKKSAMSFDDALSEVNAVTMQGEADPISGLKSITSETASDGTVTYTVEYSNAPLKSAAAQVAAGVEYKSMTSVASVKDGALVSMAITMNSSHMLGDVRFDMEMSTTASNIKFNDDITVTLPQDLDTYPEE